MEDEIWVVNCCIGLALRKTKGISSIQKASVILQKSLNVTKSAFVGPNTITPNTKSLNTKTVIAKTKIAITARTKCHLNTSRWLRKDISSFGASNYL
jgi:hypothetical protein